MKILGKSLNLGNKGNLTSENGITLFSLAKLANQELLLESLLYAKGSFYTLFLERYKKKRKTFKFKVIATKILYSVIFGILPILLILTYLEILENIDIVAVGPETDSLVLTGIIFYGLYFVLQFFNFFLMGIMESSMVMSGVIFNWFETLPIPRDRLKRLAYLTIFRSFDVPIIFIVLGFPITMLIQTQNFIIFILSLGISFANIIFSFDILILLGERLNKVLYSKKSSPRKALMIRLLNILSYIAVILGTIYVIQWVFGSVDDIFLSLLLFEQAPFANIILSTLPYPFNPSYLLSAIMTPSLISINLWVSTIVGMGLFILIIFVIHMKTSNTLSKITSSGMKIQQMHVKEEIQVKVKSRSTVGAFLRKDLSVASHDIKVALSLIMPIILSCIFIFGFNVGNSDTPIYLVRDIIVYGLGILIFCPIITTMLVYGISSIDLSGETVLAALPIDPRDRAKAKLILMLILQTVAIFVPSFLYILHPKFLSFFSATLATAPFAWTFLVWTYELKISFFNKFRDKYIIPEVKPQNRFFKWTLIICIEYIVIFWMLSFILIFYINQLIITINIFYIVTLLISSIFCIIAFNKMFPYVKEKRIEYLLLEARTTWFTRHRFISSIILLIFFYINSSISYFILMNVSIFEYYSYGIFSLVLVIIYNLSFVPLFFFIIPKIMGLPNGKENLSNYFVRVKLSWLRKSFKLILWSILGFLGIFLPHLIIANLPYDFIYVPEEFLLINPYLFYMIMYFGILFWQELVYRGIILTMFLENRKKIYAILISVIIILLFRFVPEFLINPIYIFYEDQFAYMIVSVISTLIIQLIVAYLFTKTKSLIPGLIVQLLMLFIFIPGMINSPFMGGFPYF